MKNLSIILLIIISFLFTFLYLTTANAQGSDPEEGGSGITQPVTLPDPLGMGDDPEAPQKLIGKIINAILGIVGSLALVMFIYGGVTWMLAAGNQEKVKKGKDILVWATVGLVVIFSAYALVKFVFTGLGVTG